MISTCKKQTAGIFSILFSYERDTPELLLELLPTHNAPSVSVCGVAETQARKVRQPKPSARMPKVKPVHAKISQRATPSSSLVLHTPWVHNAKSSPWAASITPECEGTVIFWNKIKTIDDSGRSACSSRRRTKALSRCSENKASTNKLLLSSQHSGPSASPDMHPTYDSTCNPDRVELQGQSQLK